ncbi:hypothetical protein N9L97_03445 [Cyclobacteriaceae bacterium]|nr:hypothetical protein [Cyclobacteriaceae bacterium]
MRYLVFSSLFILIFLLFGCSKEEEDYENAISFLNNNPITTKAIFSEDFNELQNHSTLQGKLLSDVDYSFVVNMVGDFQITQSFNNCNYQTEDARIWLNIYGSNYKANFKDISSIKEDIFTGMDSTSYRLILNFAPIKVGSLCVNNCQDQYRCSQDLPSLTNIAPTTTIYTQQYLIFNDADTRALYKTYFEILRDGF